MKVFKTLAVLALLIMLPTATVSAKVTLPHFITDSMVVQQLSRLTLPGTAKPGAVVRVKASWNNIWYRCTADKSGKFKAIIPTPKAGGPYTITIKDESTRVLKDILVGEVWLCSGQSNMEMPVIGWGKVLNYEQEKANAKYHNIRLLQVKKTIAYRPQDDVEVNMGGWRPCSPSTVENFSAVAYFYARELSKKLNVPIGVIDCDWGGTPAEAWTEIDSVAKVNDGYKKIADYIRSCGFDKEKLLKDYSHILAGWEDEMNMKDIGFDKSQIQGNWSQMSIPGSWENSGLPNFDGVVWMQYEMNVPDAAVGKELTLHLGAIDDDDATYFNGVKIGSTVGYNVQRIYKVPAELVKKTCVITVRVSDYGGEGGLTGPSSEMYAQSENEKTPIVGKWHYSIGSPLSSLPRRPMSPDSPCYPTVLYNGMENPLRVLPVKGVIWYQGENNVGRAEEYSRLFPTMIRNWRAQRNAEIPFYFVQLAAYLKPETVQPQSQWALLREAQTDALRLNKTGMAVTIDVGDPANIHPKNKQEVGRRLALIALNHTYGQNVISEAPHLVNYKVEGTAIILNFSGKVTTGGNEPKGFIIKNQSGNFFEAKASLVDDTTIKVVCDKVQKPAAVRYDWADCPDGNLRGTTALPVAPFRTDR